MQKALYVKSHRASELSSACPEARVTSKNRVLVLGLSVQTRVTCGFNRVLFLQVRFSFRLFVPLIQPSLEPEHQPHKYVLYTAHDSNEPPKLYPQPHYQLFQLFPTSFSN